MRKSFQQRDVIKQLSPPWLARGIGEKFMYTIGLLTDCLLEKMNQAMRAHLPGQGDPSALPYLGQDRLLLQGPAEPNASFVARLQQAFSAWQEAGSRSAILGQVAAYLQTQNPSVPMSSVVPTMAIVGGNSTATTWSTLYNIMPVGAQPAYQSVATNWNWDGSYPPWRSWLVLYFTIAPTAGSSGTVGSINYSLSVTSATNATPIVITTSAAHGMTSSFPVTISGVGGNTAANGTFVATALTTTTFSLATKYGVPVAGNGAYTSGGLIVSIGFATFTGPPSGTAAAGQWITISGAATSANNGTFFIVSVSGTNVTYANPAAVAGDANNGALHWSIGTYPIIGPDGVWDDGSTWDDGGAWDLNCSPQTVITLRSLVSLWKSAGTYYPWMIFAFDGADGSTGSMFSVNSSPGSGNPDGTWATWAKTVGGVSVAARQTTSPWDAFCDGTGQYLLCSVPNVT